MDVWETVSKIRRGSSNASIHRTAMHVLTDISRYCNYDSVSDLILFNSDYLINSVALQFRHMMLGSVAPAVLSVILKLCDRDIMSVVCDATADVSQKQEILIKTIFFKNLPWCHCLLIIENEMRVRTGFYSQARAKKIVNIKLRSNFAVAQLVICAGAARDNIGRWAQCWNWGFPHKFLLLLSNFYLFNFLWGCNLIFAMSFILMGLLQLSINFQDMACECSTTLLFFLLNYLFVESSH